MYSNIANKQIGPRSSCCHRDEVKLSEAALTTVTHRTNADLKRVASLGNVVHA